MFAQVTLRSFLWLVSLWAILIIGIISCGGDDDDNDWVGTWAMETVDGESLEQDFAEDFGDADTDLDITANEWTFNNDGTMEMEFGVKFEVKEQGLTISGEGSIRMMGTYSLSGSNYTLTPKEVEGTGLFEGDVEPVGPTDEETGTWSRNGNTLTLNSDDGSTIVFNKK
ncbi:hypothetical protein C6502_04320 [Candidatus Poribacteria bacterium]|nr:MAG: hypothetical protein C6502_04320 [Candidatus Poribacteria bacterium]